MTVLLLGWRPVRGDVDFEKDVAPVLQEHCLSCHGPERAEGSLRLDSEAHVLKGGDSGVIVTPAASAESELIRRLKTDDASERMPLDRPALDEQAIAALESWIDAGANWPERFVIQSPDAIRLARAATHWSFQPIERPTVPDASDGHALSGIDRFIRDRLRQAGITPSPEADRETLIRRVTLDLIGLPPTPEEVDAFLADDHPDAYERLVDRLLASPHYGERWARPWLDLCHYADTDGYLTDQQRPVAWRYRQWLVDALNANMPFDRFTIEQLAGDLLPDATMNQRIATGFLRQTLSNREGGADLEEFRVKQILDRSQMVGTIWLGLTVGCAQCHDHKYDPLSQQEFYEFYACLNNADEINVDAPLPEEADAYFASREEYNARRQELIAPLATELEELQRRWEEKLLYAWKHPGEDHVWDRQWELLGLVWGGNLGEGQLEGIEIVKLDWEERTPRQKDDLLDYFLQSGSVIDADRFAELKLGALKAELDALRQQYPRATRAPMMQAALTPRQTYIFGRGDFRDRGDDVDPDLPDWLPDWEDTNDPSRLRLAHWLISRENPLTARVTVNRMWQAFFGQGLVTTPEDFGARGAKPSHPDLLDWLAVEFIDSGWDVKEMHRRIVTSATYRQSSAARQDVKARDPQNVLLARQSSLRVPAEVVRDQALAASGLLSRTIGGPSVKPPQPERVTMEAFGYNDWQVSPAPDRYRRSVYTFVIRTAPFAQGIIFDAPNPNEICTRRVRSNTPLQALTLLNDPMFFEMACAMAGRVLTERNEDDARIAYAFRLAVARHPAPAEAERLQRFLEEQRKAFESQPTLADEWPTDAVPANVSSQEFAAWCNLCSALLNLHEFVTRD